MSPQRPKTVLPTEILRIALAQPAPKLNYSGKHQKRKFKNDIKVELSKLGQRPPPPATVGKRRRRRNHVKSSLGPQQPTPPVVTTVQPTIKTDHCHHTNVCAAQLCAQPPLFRAPYDNGGGRALHDQRYRTIGTTDPPLAAYNDGRIGLSGTCSVPQHILTTWDHPSFSTNDSLLGHCNTFNPGCPRIITDATR